MGKNEHGSCLFPPYSPPSPLTRQKDLLKKKKKKNVNMKSLLFFTDLNFKLKGKVKKNVFNEQFFFFFFFLLGF